MNSILQSKLLSLGLLVIIGLFGVSLIKIMPSVIDSHDKVNHISAQLNSISIQKADLEQKSDYLNSDSYLDRQARLKLNYKKPDENVVFVYKNQYNTTDPKGSIVPKTTSTPQPTQTIAPKVSVLPIDLQTRPNWQKWFDYLMGN